MSQQTKSDLDLFCTGNGTGVMCTDLGAVSLSGWGLAQDR